MSSAYTLWCDPGTALHLLGACHMHRSPFSASRVSGVARRASKGPGRPAQQHGLQNEEQEERTEMQRTVKPVGKVHGPDRPGDDQEVAHASPDTPPRPDQAEGKNQHP